MDERQKTILKIVKAGWMPDLSINNFPKTHSGLDSTAKNLEEALSAIEELGVGVFSISAQRPDVLELISYARESHPRLVAGIHSLMDTPRSCNRAKKHGLRVPPSPTEAYRAGARILTSQGSFRKKTYAKLGNDAVLIAGGTTPTEWLAEWEKGANFVKFPGAELFPPSYMATYMPSFHNLIPFYISGYIVKPEWRLDKEKIKTALAPYINTADGEFVGTFTFGFGYPFNSETKNNIIEKGSLLLEAIAEIRKGTKIPSVLTLYEAINGARIQLEVTHNTGRSFNA